MRPSSGRQPAVPGWPLSVANVILFSSPCLQIAASSVPYVIFKFQMVHLPIALLTSSSSATNYSEGIALIDLGCPLLQLNLRLIGNEIGQLLTSPHSRATQTTGRRFDRQIARAPSSRLHSCHTPSVNSSTEPCYSSAATPPATSATNTMLHPRRIPALIAYIIILPKIVVHSIPLLGILQSLRSNGNPWRSEGTWKERFLLDISGNLQ